jgi:signal peptidase I
MNLGQHADSSKSGFFRTFISFIIMVAIVLVCAWLLRTYVISPYEIPSGSMETTIMTSDKVFSEKVSYYTRSVRPGDIVTFGDPEVIGRTLIKRCIATGGQTVDLVNGTVYVDGVAKTEPYTNGQPSYPLTTAAGVSISYPYTVPDGYLWVMGDNRTDSADSRYFGAIPASSVTGRACFVYWPLNRMQVLE